MLTFVEHMSSGYLAYKLSARSRSDLLHHFTTKYSETDCDHITFKFPAKSTDALPPKAHTAHVVGYADSGDGIEALVVELNGTTKRPDGKLYHITLSLDRTKGKKPVHSNGLVASGYKHVAPVSIQVEPTFLSN